MKKVKVGLIAVVMAVMMYAGCKAVGGESELSESEEQRVQDLLALYSITFEVHGGQWGDGSTGAITVGQEPGAAVILPEAGVPQREGYLFQGWYTDGDAGTTRVEDLGFSTKLSIRLPAGTVAVSAATVFTIDEEDEEVVLKPGTYENAHEAGEESFEKVAWEPKVVYAIWRTLTPGVIPVTFLDFKNSTNRGEVVGVTEGGTIPASEIPHPQMQHSVRDGEGWFRNDTDAEFDLNTEFNDETIESGNLRDLYLYAKWVGATYTVTFNMNGATGAAPAPVSVQYPTKLSNGQIPRNVTRQYYSFRGWFLGQRPVGTELTVNTVIDGNKIFYAGWTASAEADAVRQNLQALYNEVNNTINTQSGQSIDRQYKDEYVIGSGVYSSSADPNLIIQINRVNGLLNKAALLLRGDTHYETVLVENGSGGVSEQLFEVTDYNYNEMKRVTDEINAFKQRNPAFDYGRIQPKMVNITQTGSVHSVTIATGGNYRIEAYGGSGGHIWSKNNKTALGGAGGHVKGVINLPAGTVLKVRVGGEGVGSASATINSGGSVNFSSNSNAKQNGPFNGGYNGGGKGGKSELKDYTGGSGGGGVSDVRRVATAYADGQNNYQNGVGTLDGFDKRIIVAAGGGGAGQSADVGNGNWPGIPGGKGGPTGESGKRRGEGTTGGITANAARGGTAEKLQPVTNIGGNSKLSGTQLGVGADGAASSWIAVEGTGGGGGGYYGGEAIQNLDQSNDKWHYPAFTASGAGGSNYVGTGFIGTVNEATTRYGNGYVIIEYIPE